MTDTNNSIQDHVFSFFKMLLQNLLLIKNKKKTNSIFSTN